MRRRLLFAIAGLGLTAVSPAPASAQVPTRDSLTGSGSVLGATFAVAVESGPRGENPSGTLRLDPFITRATATCLNVSDNTAVVGFRIEEPVQIAQGFIAALRDNGPPSSGQPVDELLSFAFLDASPTECPDPTGPLPGSVIDPPAVFDTGDIVITDAQPFPASKDQCKNGGWRSFPGFQHQGECVAFVERRPKP
jgi:hypothetical protein